MTKQLEEVLTELKEARQEASNLRRQTKEAEQRLATSLSPHEVSAAVEQARRDQASQLLALKAERLALRNHLPADLMGIYRDAVEGKTAEEAETYAVALGNLGRRA